MGVNDISQGSPRFQINDMRVALALLTRLPLPYPPFDPTRPAANAAWAYPLVGVVIGGIVVLVILTMIWLGLPVSLSALLGLLAGIMASGAMHEDGLADCTDGFWGGWTPARRLEIMKDSQIGTYGVLALLLCLALRWQAIVVLCTADLLWVLLPAAMLSRSAMVWVMFALPHARADGLSQRTGKPAKTSVAVAIGIGLLAILIVPGLPFLPVVVWSALATWGVVWLARSKIGGQTGDVLGGTQQVVELTILLTILSSVDTP